MNDTKKNLLVNSTLLLISALFISEVYFVYQRNSIAVLEYYIPITLVFCMVALSFLLAIGWAIENKIRLLLMTTALSISFLIAEVLLYGIDVNKLITTNSYRERTAKKLGIDFDNRNKFQIVNELKTQGKIIWPNVSPEYFVESDGLALQNEKIFPLGAGIALTPTILCNESGKFSLYQSDEHGFNNPPGSFKEGVDILLIGDSFTHGACVNEGEDIASFLRKNTKLKVLNLGNSGVGPLVELASLAEYGTKLKPKKVIWLYFEGNDLADLSIELKSPFLLSYLDDNFTQNLFDRQQQIDNGLIQYLTHKNNEFLELYNPHRAKMTLLGIIKLQNLRRVLRINEENKNVYTPPTALFEVILKTAQRRVHSWGGELIFVYLPELARYKTSKIDVFNQSHLKQDILDIVQSLDIQFIDFDSTLQSYQDPSTFFPMKIEGHYTSDGYQLVANTIASHLKEESPLCMN